MSVLKILLIILAVIGALGLIGLAIEWLAPRVKTAGFWLSLLGILIAIALIVGIVYFIFCLLLYLLGGVLYLLTELGYGVASFFQSTLLRNIIIVTLVILLFVFIAWLSLRSINKKTLDTTPRYIVNLKTRVIHRIDDSSVHDIDPLYRKALTRAQAEELINRGEGFRYKKDP